MKSSYEMIGIVVISAAAPLLRQVPLAPLPRRAWVSLAVDVRGLVDCCFGGTGPARSGQAPDGRIQSLKRATAVGPSSGGDGSLGPGGSAAARAPPAAPWAYAGLDGICILGLGSVRRVFTLRDAPLREVPPVNP